MPLFYFRISTIFTNFTISQPGKEQGCIIEFYIMDILHYPGLFNKTNRLLNFVLVSMLFLFSFGSCTTTKNTSYFQTLLKDTSLSGLVNKDFDSKIIIGDNLGINISSLSMEEDVLFNKGSLTGNTITSPGFLVDNDGNIFIHKIGLIKAAGNTRKELAAVIQKQLAPFLKDPIVIVQYLNHKITVMGEVVNPKVLNMPDEQMSLIDAIVLSGDVKENARRDNILLIREKGNEKIVKHINLSDHSIFSSPWYYVQPNDIIYVSPDFEKQAKKEKQLRFQANFGIILSTVSLLIIIIDRLIR